MQKAGKLWIPDGDHFFAKRFNRTGDRFDYEQLLAAMRRTPMDRRRVAIDVGAHVGSWTIHLAKWFDRVIAIEPEEDNYACLRENVIDLPNVVTCRLACGLFTGPMCMLPGTNTGCWYITKSGRKIVNMTPLDDLNIKHVDFLKIDVEGYELNVLKGGRKTIERDRPTILIEQNGLEERFGFRRNEAGEYLEDLRYKLSDVVNKDYIYTYPKEQ